MDGRRYMGVQGTRRRQVYEGAGEQNPRWGRVQGTRDKLGYGGAGYVEALADRRGGNTEVGGHERASPRDIRLLPGFTITFYSWRVLRVVVTAEMEERMIAPCGMNCALCISYQAREYDLNSQGFRRTCCEGCLPRGRNCLHMGDGCRTLGEGLVRFCHGCGDFPCRRLRALDRRYRTKYRLSMIENLMSIRDRGLEHFLKGEEEKWACPGCGKPVCCHNGLCLNCDLDTLRRNRKYRWGHRE